MLKAPSEYCCAHKWKNMSQAAQTSHYTCWHHLLHCTWGYWFWFQHLQACINVIPGFMELISSFSPFLFVITYSRFLFAWFQSVFSKVCGVWFGCRRIVGGEVTWNLSRHGAHVFFLFFLMGMPHPLSLINFSSFAILHHCYITLSYDMVLFLATMNS